MFKKFCSVTIALVLILSLLSLPAWASSASAESNTPGSSLQLNEIDPSNYYDVLNVDILCSCNDTLVDVSLDDSQIVICNATGETLSQRPDFDSNSYYLWELIGSTASPIKDLTLAGSYNEVSGSYALSAENSSPISLSEVSDGIYSATVCFDLIFIPGSSLGMDVIWSPIVTVDQNVDRAPDSWNISVFEEGSTVPLNPNEYGAYSLKVGTIYNYTIDNLFVDQSTSAKYTDIHRSFIATEDIDNNILLTEKYLNQDTIGYAVYLVVFDKNNPRVELRCDILAINEDGDSITLRSSVDGSLSGFLPPDSFTLVAVPNGHISNDLIVSYSF